MNDHKIDLFKVRMSPEAARAVQRVLFSGQLSEGPEVARFESELADLLSLPRGRPVTVNSATSALHLAYHLAGVGQGVIVLATPMTCAATITPIVALGALPIWVDVDADTGHLDPDAIGRTIAWLAGRSTRKARALVAVDWAGVPADYHGIRGALGDHGIPIIEDAAHAMLAAREGKQIGQYAELDGNLYVCYSLQAIKHLTSGDGGILVCPNEEKTARARRLRWFGLDRDSKTDFRAGQDISESGYKFHMNDIAAAIGSANISALGGALHCHRNNAKLLRGSFIDLAPHVITAPHDLGGSYWVFNMCVDNRASFVEHLTARGITCSEVHRRNDLHAAFRQQAPEQPPLPGLDAFAARQISIPCGWWLTTNELDRIIDAVRGWAKTQRGTS